MPARRPAVAVLLTGALALGLSACDGQDEPEETTPGSTPVFEQQAPTTGPSPDDDAADQTDGARTDGARTGAPPPGGVSPVDDAVDPVQTGAGDDDDSEADPEDDSTP